MDYTILKKTKSPLKNHVSQYLDTTMTSSVIVLLMYGFSDLADSFLLLYYLPIRFKAIQPSPGPGQEREIPKKGCHKEITIGVLV